MARLVRLVRMKWERRDKHFAESDLGYRILFTPGLGGEGWLFMAWTPARTVERNEYLAHYPRGEAVPQPRNWIGTYDTADRAREACEQHWEGESEKAAS